VFVCSLSISLSLSASALDLSKYTETSALATGSWVKVSIPESGIYAISKATLSRWGFSDPSRVRIYGYGGQLINDELSQNNYVDDLPMVQSVTTDNGSVVFYGVGPETWTQSASEHFVRTSNHFTNYGYYYVTDSDAAIPDIETVGRAEATSPQTTFTQYLQHEQDLVSPGEAGAALVGEDFRYTPSRSFSFKMPGKADDNVWMECSFVTKTYTGTSSIAFTANGNTVQSNSTDLISATVKSDYNHGSVGTSRHEFDVSGESLVLGIRYSSSVTVYAAWLNYIAINYTRSLSLGSTDGYLPFTLNRTAAQLSGASADTRVWDVTDPANIVALNTSAVQNNTIEWTNAYSGTRNYVAWSPSAKMPEPTYVSRVSNQNLHASQGTNMVIFTAAQWSSQADRIAELHRSEGLDVTVVDVEQVYNEFGSGSADIGAMRRYLKMLYDRGKNSGTELKYALLMGRATYDNRHVTSEMENSATTLPIWVASSIRQTLSDNEGYSTDDFLAMLEDGSGTNLGRDRLSIAVGRMPVTSLTQATSDVDKLAQYVQKAKTGIWRNHIMTLADDGDSGDHMTQTERFVSNLQNTDRQQFLVNKVFIDAYERQNGVYPMAREEMFRLLDEGTMFWTFVGHANNHSWTHEGQLTYNDINSMYLNRLPILYAATCNFLRWDSNTLSGGEIMWHERYGGTIATISATRPVYILYNGYLTASMGRHLGERDANNRYYTLGEVYQRAKNDIRNYDDISISDTNHLRYVLMGDPALRMVIPDNIVRLDAINGVAVDGNNQPTIAARQTVTLEGSVIDGAGELLNDFNGTINVTLYDAEYSTTTNGNMSNNTEGKEVTFESHGKRVYAGASLVENGRFTLQFRMPSEISDNFRPATANMYALSSDNSRQAIGVNNQFYMYGYDDTAEADNEDPVISTMYLNHTSFKDGDTVNPDPMLIAEISDNQGINLSQAGIGRQMILVLDGSTTYSDVSEYFSVANNGIIGGTINYPLSSLIDGDHTLKLRIWDTDENFTESTISFTVKENVAPKIYDVWSDSNPASEQANFYISHDRPDQMATVTITVYNLLGQPIWSSSVTGISDMFTSTPVTWNLCDAAGRRVQRGIYLYRATISTDDITYDTESKRIAVTN
jgi:hypothetical protein